MEKINARKAREQGRRWRKRRTMEEKKFPWQERERERGADEQVDEVGSGRDTSDEEREGETNGRGGPLIM